MNITPPYAYGEVVPLTTTTRVRKSTAGVPDVFRTTTAIPLSYSEIPVASRDYPIAFVSGDGGSTFLAMAVLGLEARQNLFVDDDGTWLANLYVPAYVRRYPFCMSKVTRDGQEQAERIVCVEKSAVTEDGDMLYDAAGKALSAWEASEKFLFEFEADLARTETMCATLHRLNLMEPFTVQAVPTAGASPLSLTGLNRVSEQKLMDLPADELKDLVTNGVLSRLYAHILSQLNFQRLLDRRAAKAPAS